MDDDLDPFESSRILLDSAKVNISDLDRLCAEFASNCLGPIREHFDTAAREKIIYIQLAKKLPNRLLYLAHSIINDLKHSLDQATGDAAILLGRKNAKNIYFPIGKTPTHFDQSVQRHLKGVNPHFRDHLVRLDVNERGNPHLYSVLSLAGPNKHQRIASVTTKTSSTIGGPLFESIKGPVSLNSGRWSRRKNEIEWIRIGEAGHIRVWGHLYDAFKPTIRIVLKNGPGRGDEPIATTLFNAFEECFSIVSGIEAETRRLAT